MSLPSVQLIEGDCLKVLPTLAENSVDSIICDPPYGLEFMSNEWDGADGFRRSLNQNDAGRNTVFGRSSRTSPEYRAGRLFCRFTRRWATEALRVAKPGAFLLCFGGTRTFHWLGVGVEMAGWCIRDSVWCWNYATGFPKSLDISKAIDKAAGSEKVIGSKPDRWTGRGNSLNFSTDRPQSTCKVTSPATDAAKLWSGWGTALKPSVEPILVAMKPLDGTFAQNALKWGVAGLNIDGGRIPGSIEATRFDPSKHGHDGWRMTATGDECAELASVSGGRWPANTIICHHPDCKQVGTRIVRGDPRGECAGTCPGGFVDIGAEPGDGEPNATVYGDQEVPVYECHPDCHVAELDRQAGIRTSGKPAGIKSGGQLNCYGHFAGGVPVTGYGDSGSASRFFYCPKASRSERGVGNNHPTVKPIALIEYLCRLTATPTGGTVLDPFAGSGTTGLACLNTGRPFIGIEREPAYFAIAKDRLDRARDGRLFA